MRILPDERFFLVFDPSAHATELDDVLIEITIRSLEGEFRGGLTCDRHPTIFTERAEAETEARRRLEAWKRYQEEVTRFESPQA